MPPLRDPDFQEHWDTFDALVESTRQQVGDSATVEVQYLNEGRIGVCAVNPYRPGARRIDITAEQWLLVELGGVGGRFELDYTAEDVALATRVIEATVAGRVKERAAWGRSEVTVTFEEGETVSEIGIDGCLPALVPLPGWRRWGRLIVSEAYSDAAPGGAPGRS